MPEQVHHSGAEGIVTAAGIDWNVKSWEATETIGTRDTTNTSDYVPAENRVYRNQEGYKCSLEGTFEFDWDSNNSPVDPANLDTTIRAGNKVPVVLTLPNGRAITLPKALITSTPIKTEGMEGIFSVTVQFGNAGPYIWS